MRTNTTQTQHKLHLIILLVFFIYDHKDNVMPAVKRHLVKLVVK